MGVEQGTLIKNRVEPVIRAGRLLAAMPKDVRHPIAAQVLNKVRRNRGSMRPLEIGDLRESLRSGRSIGAFDNGLLAYAQIWPMENPGQSGLPDGTMEVGTWVSFVSGMGSSVIQPATELAVVEFGAPMAVALVQQDNTKAKDTLLAIGAESIGEKPSDYIPGNPIMTVFNLPLMKL